MSKPVYKNTVYLPDLPAESVQQLVELAYTGWIKITNQKVEHLLFAASVLKVSPPPFPSNPTRF